jgi:hypothetical protein
MTYCNILDNSARNMAPESIGGRVPNKYCIVLNNDLVRIRYLLVYSQEFGCLRYKIQLLLHILFNFICIFYLKPILNKILGLHIHLDF